MGENNERSENETEVKEFVSRDAHTNLKKKAARARQSYTKKSAQSALHKFASNKPLLALLAYAAAAAAAIVLSVLVCRIPVVAVCFIAIIETMLAACLHNLPVWLHVLVAAAELLCGVLFKKVLFMFIQTVLYVAAIAALRVFRQRR